MICFCGPLLNNSRFRLPLILCVVAPACHRLLTDCQLSQAMKLFDKNKTFKPKKALAKGTKRLNILDIVCSFFIDFLKTNASFQIRTT
jgi:hypothetical protein